MSSELIFVTGASGFLGSYIVNILLDKGYRVRAAARGAKVGDLQQRLAWAGDAFEVVSVADLATDQFPELLKGVDAVIHAGSPLAGRGEPEDILKGAIEGSLNVIRQAEKAGIKKIVVTGSVAAMNNPQGSFTDKDWNPVTKEYALKDRSAMVVYGASKTLAERAIWEFAQTHPHLDVTVLNPPFIYGPFIPGFEIPSPNFSTISTDLLIFRLLRPDGPFPPSRYIDVRDVALAHVLALSSSPAKDGRAKRIPIASPHPFNWTEAIEYVAAKRPELKDRFPDPKKVVAETTLPPDFKRVQEVIGLKESEFRKWEETLLDTIDALVELEKNWKAKGYEVEIPLV